MTLEEMLDNVQEHVSMGDSMAVVRFVLPDGTAWEPVTTHWEQVTGCPSMVTIPLGPAAGPPERGSE